MPGPRLGPRILAVVAYVASAALAISIGLHPAPPPTAADRLNLAMRYVAAENDSAARSIAAGAPDILSAIDEAEKPVPTPTPTPFEPVSSSFSIDPSLDPMARAASAWEQGDQVDAERLLRAQLDLADYAPARALLGRILVLTYRPFEARSLLNTPGVTLSPDGTAALAHALDWTSQPWEGRALLEARSDVLASPYAWAVYAEVLSDTHASSDQIAAALAQGQSLIDSGESPDDGYLHRVLAVCGDGLDADSRQYELSVASSLEPASSAGSTDGPEGLLGTGALPAWEEELYTALQEKDAADSEVSSETDLNGEDTPSGPYWDPATAADQIASEVARGLSDPIRRWDTYAQLAKIYGSLGLSQRGSGWRLRAIVDHVDAPEAYQLNLTLSDTDLASQVLAARLLELQPENQTALQMLGQVTP